MRRGVESSLKGRLEASKEMRVWVCVCVGGGDSLQRRLEASKERWRHEEGERDREEPLRRDG